MKNKIVIILFFILSASNAQDSGDIEFGLFGGLNLTNVSTIEDQQAAKTLVAFNGGFYGEYFFSESWGIKTRAYYNQNGWDDGIFIFNGTAFITNYSLHYLTGSVAPNWHFGGKRKSFYLSLGPYLGFLVGANAEGTQIKEFFNKTDIGLVSSFGYQVPLSRKGKSKFFVELVGQAGFTDIFEENEGDAVRNRRTSLNIGITF